MDQAKKEELSRDWVRFMIIGGLLYNTFYTLLERTVASERLPFRYFLLAGAVSFAVEVALYFSIRNWPGYWKTRVVWLIGLIWLGVVLLGGR